MDEDLRRRERSASMDPSGDEAGRLFAGLVRSGTLSEHAVDWLGFACYRPALSYLGVRHEHRGLGVHTFSNSSACLPCTRSNLTRFLDHLPHAVERLGSEFLAALVLGVSAYAYPIWPSVPWAPCGCAEPGNCPRCGGGRYIAEKLESMRHLDDLLVAYAMFPTPANRNRLTRLRPEDLRHPWYAFASILLTTSIETPSSEGHLHRVTLTLVQGVKRLARFGAAHYPTPTLLLTLRESGARHLLAGLSLASRVGPDFFETTRLPSF